MDKENILTKLKAFLQEKGNPYLYGTQDKFGNDFEGFHSESWKTGGLTGGNCWGDAADREIDCEDPNKIDLLNEFLVLEMPEITEEQYQRIESLIEEYDFGVGEYYGNFTEYSVAYIKFDKLAECLANLGITPSKPKYKM